MNNTPVFIVLLLPQRRRAVAGVSQNFRGIFRMVGIGKLAVFFDDEEEAKKHLAETR